MVPAASTVGSGASKEFFRAGGLSLVLTHLRRLEHAHTRLQAAPQRACNSSSVDPALIMQQLNGV